MNANVRFKKAQKSQAKLRMAIDGPSGSGKTYTGLIAATALANGGKIAVIDTEHGSASKYADMFEFDTLELATFHPQNYIDGIEVAEEAGYIVLLIDSLSHAWEGEGGVLELHDAATKRQPSGNSWTAWRDVTPIHRDLVEAILQAKLHVIATMRSKTDYIQTTDDKGRTIIKKVGMAPVQRAGMEYEFDVVADMDTDHNMVISKTRCFAIADQVVSKPRADWFTTLRDWLSDGAPMAEPPKAMAEAPKPDKQHLAQQEGISVQHRADNSDGPAWRKQFHSWLGQWSKNHPEVALDYDGVVKPLVLKVQHLSEFAGTLADAEKLIIDYTRAHEVGVYQGAGK